MALFGFMSGMGCNADTVHGVFLGEPEYPRLTLVLWRLLATIYSYLPVSFPMRLEKLVRLKPGLRGLEVLKAEEKT